MEPRGPWCFCFPPIVCNLGACEIFWTDSPSIPSSGYYLLHYRSNCSKDDGYQLLDIKHQQDNQLTAPICNQDTDSSHHQTHWSSGKLEYQSLACIFMYPGISSTLSQKISLVCSKMRDVCSVRKGHERTDRQRSGVIISGTEAACEYQEPHHQSLSHSFKHLTSLQCEQACLKRLLMLGAPSVAHLQHIFSEYWECHSPTFSYSCSALHR